MCNETLVFLKGATISFLWIDTSFFVPLSINVVNDDEVDVNDEKKVISLMIV